MNLIHSINMYSMKSPVPDTKFINHMDARKKAHDNQCGKKQVIESHRKLITIDRIFGWE